MIYILNSTIKKPKNKGQKGRKSWHKNTRTSLKVPKPPTSFFLYTGVPPSSCVCEINPIRSRPNVHPGDGSPLFPFPWRLFLPLDSTKYTDPPQ